MPDIDKAERTYNISKKVAGKIVPLKIKLDIFDYRHSIRSFEDSDSIVTLFKKE